MEDIDNTSKNLFNIKARPFLLFKKSKKLLKVFCVLLSILFSLQACSKRTSSSEQERLILDKFFRYLLLNESGIYTLVSSKPITEGQFFYEEDNEKKKLHWDKLSEEEKRERILLINRDKPEDMSFYKNLPKEIKKKAIILRDRDYILDQSQVIKNWDVIEKIPLSANYILKREKLELSTEEGPIPFYNIFFVNVLETALLLQKNYELFRNVVGFDFDAMSVVLELKEEKSEFWDKLEESKNSLLWGLLYGFGDKNSFVFQWKHNEKYGLSNVLQTFSYEEFIPNPTIKNFPIPTFVSFFKDDPVVDHYKKERDKIQKLYEGKNFLDFSLKILCGS